MAHAPSESGLCGPRRVQIVVSSARRQTTHGKGHATRGRCRRAARRRHQAAGVQIVVSAGLLRVASNKQRSQPHHSQLR